MVRAGGVRIALALAVAAAAYGCIPLHRHGRIGDGPSPRGAALRQEVRHERWTSALARLAADSTRGEDELLRLQQLALVTHYAGDHRASNDALQRAHRILDDRYTRRISRGLLATLTSDRTLPYRPATTERFFLHYYGALNYLRLGELDEAAVEARRLSRELEQGGGAPTSSSAGPPEESENGTEMPADAGAPRDSPFRDLRCALYYLAGAVFEAAGETNDASVAYRRARALGGPTERPASRRSAAAGDSTGHLLVVVERGFIVHRIAESLNVVVWPRELEELRSVEGAVGEDGRRELARRVALRMLDDGEGGEGSTGTAAADRATGISGRSGRADVTDRGGRSATRRTSGRRSGDEAPYFLRVAWPRLSRSPGIGNRAEIRVDDRPPTATDLTADLSSTLRREFRGRAPERLARAVVRAAVKYGVSQAVEEGVSRESETLGDVAGFAVNAVLSGMERTDLRSWHLLPTRLEMARLRVPAGRRRVVVEIPGSGGTPRRVRMGEVTVRPGGISVLTARLWE